MIKAHIIQEIKRTAESNNMTPLGVDRFESETGIKEWHWKKFWPRWSDAVREAGFIPNKLTSAYDEIYLLNQYAKLSQELGRLPSQSDIIFKAHNDPNFPTEKTFRRFGGKAKLVKRLIEHCQTIAEYTDVKELCAEFSTPRKKMEEEPVLQDFPIGSVYLVKSGSYYKIGRSNSVGRREYELSIQLPEKTKTLHVIRTDDPSGIEAYWHSRFASKRKNGEWFELSTSDLAIFKRRKFM